MFDVNETNVGKFNAMSVADKMKFVVENSSTDAPVRDVARQFLALSLKDQQLIVAALERKS
jgi:hypothetical protein